MEPKFQSSFIPKGPVSSGPQASSFSSAPRKQRDFLTVIASFVFALSIIAALGSVGYKYFLKYRISQMGQELVDARAALQTETVDELIDASDRIVSTRELLKNHKVLSPLFDFLEQATPKTVRYTEFNYANTNKGLELRLKGEAKSYGALAAASDIFNRSQNFSNPVFSDLTLDSKGNVTFSVTATVNPTFVSYESFVSGNLVEAPAPITKPANATSTASSTRTN